MIVTLPQHFFLTKNERIQLIVESNQMTKSITIVHIDKDCYFGFESSCPHSGGPLSRGVIDIESLRIECPWHKFIFDLSTGESFDDSDRPLTVYSVKKCGPFEIDIDISGTFIRHESISCSKLTAHSVIKMENADTLAEWATMILNEPSKI
jgi:nitrite reductase/ring-hydroxylating ferredoxin subunit